MTDAATGETRTAATGEARAAAGEAPAAAPGDARTVATRLRPPELRPAPLASPEPPREPSRSGFPAGRTVPLRLVLLVGLAVLVALSVWRPGSPAAVLGVPLALVLPGTIVQRRYLAGVGRPHDVALTWAVRLALSLGWWVVIGGAVALGRVPVFSGWTVGAGAVLAAAVLIGDPGGRARWGVVSARAAGAAVAALAIVLAVAFGGWGLARFAGGGLGPGTGTTVSFADPDVPVALAPTGAEASVDIVVSNPGAVAVQRTVSVQVGAGLPWTSVIVTVPAGGTKTVTVSGAVLVCRDAQQLGVTLDGALAPALTAMVPGAIDAAACPTS